MATTEAALAAAPARESRRVTIWQSIRRQRLALTGALIVAFFALVAIVGPSLAPYGPTEQFIEDRLQPPGGNYLLGTDEFGRDIFSRLLYGARISFQVGAIAVGIAGALGIALGLIAGYVGGWVDNLLTMLMDILFAFPPSCWPSPSSPCWATT
jgi:peptide/nickel transport system permease protein